MDSQLVDGPATAPRYSPDGRLWWDGQRWRSLDGSWWWDGQRWQAVPLQPLWSSQPQTPPAQGLMEFFFTKPPARWYGNGRRVIFGSLWTFYTAVSAAILLFTLLTALVVSMAQPGTLLSVSPGVLVLGLLTFLTGSYAYRIWTWRARVLWLLIFF
jgi:hypothetical protein